MDLCSPTSSVASHALVTGSGSSSLTSNQSNNQPSRSQRQPARSTSNILPALPHVLSVGQLQSSSTYQSPRSSVAHLAQVHWRNHARVWSGLPTGGDATLANYASNPIGSRRASASTSTSGSTSGSRGGGRSGSSSGTINSGSASARSSSGGGHNIDQRTSKQLTSQSTLNRTIRNSIGSKSSSLAQQQMETT